MPQEGKADVESTVSSFPDWAAGLEITGAEEKRAKKADEGERFSSFYTRLDSSLGKLAFLRGWYVHVTPAASKEI